MFVVNSTAYNCYISSKLYSNVIERERERHRLTSVCLVSPQTNSQNNSHPLSNSPLHKTKIFPLFISPQLISVFGENFINLVWAFFNISVTILNCAHTQQQTIVVSLNDLRWCFVTCFFFCFFFVEREHLCMREVWCWQTKQHYKVDTGFFVQTRIEV